MIGGRDAAAREKLEECGSLEAVSKTGGAVEIVKSCYRRA